MTSQLTIAKVNNVSIIVIENIEKRISCLQKKVNVYRQKFEAAPTKKIEPVRRKLMKYRSEQSLLQIQLYFAQKAGIA